MLRQRCGRGLALSACLACLLDLGTPVRARAQAKDTFVQALVELSQATAGTTGREGPALQSSLAAMADGLAKWDAAVSRVEAGFAGAVVNAAPAEGARMRATLAATYLERGRVADAVPLLDAAAALDPSFLPSHLLRGIGHARLDHVEAAGAAFDDARKLDPSAGPAAYLYLRATRSAAPSRERRAAIDALAAAVRGSGAPVDAADLTVLPLELLDDGSVDVPLFPLNAYARGFALVAQAKYREGLAGLRAAVAADPLVTDITLASLEARAGSAALAAHDAEAAVQAFSSVTGGSRSAQVQRLLGVAYWSLGDYRKSLVCLRAATTLDPADERARLSLADVLVASGDRVAARESLVDTTRRFPGSGQAHWRLGRLEEDLGDEAAARRAYAAAARATPLAGASILYRAIGRLDHNALDLEAAARAYERAATLTPQSAQAHLDLGGVYRAQDRLEDALVEYLAAALVDPASASAFAAAGQVRVDMGDDEGAIALLRSAVRLDAGHAEARYALSRAWLRQGRDEEARQELAAFERIQKAAMEAQRRRFEENSRALEAARRAGSTALPAPPAAPKDGR